MLNELDLNTANALEYKLMFCNESIGESYGLNKILSLLCENLNFRVLWIILIIKNVNFNIINQNAARFAAFFSQIDPKIIFLNFLPKSAQNRIIKFS